MSDCADVQGGVLSGYRQLQHAAYLFCSIEHPARARELLREIARNTRTGAQAWPALTTEGQWADPGAEHHAMNLALSFEGMRTLGCAHAFAGFQDFAEGMAARARTQLKDTGDGDPANWQAGLRGEAHVMFALFGRGAEHRDERLGRLRSLLAGAGLRELAVQRADILDGGQREHFGFRDGFSQPAVEALPGEQRKAGAVAGEGMLAPRGMLHLRRAWRALRLGEILLGHVDEDDVVAGGEDPHGVLANGTFIVWRKLEQDVELFEQHFASLAADRRERELLKAKAVGRWKDGTSLLRRSGPPPPGAEPPQPSNEFDYSEDSAGERCPIGAHVRRANPRTSLGWGTARSMRHRIIRRGIPYDERSAGGARGLIFVCMNASIERQFEMIQAHWLLDGDAFALGAEQDVLLGQAGDEQQFTVQGTSGAARVLPVPRRALVSARGGYYLFAPGIAGLEAIAGARPARGPRRRR